jgi:hypothetical protein
MYGVGSGSAYSLYQINLATGVTTTIGPSLLRPSSLAFAALPSTIGDFNGDAIIDARDYVVWRKGLGTTYTQADYDVWRAHFGQTAGSGASIGASAAVPEPATLFMLLVGMLAACASRHAAGS